MSASVSFWYFIIFFYCEIFQKMRETENNKTVVFDKEKKLELSGILWLKLFRTLGTILLFYFEGFLGLPMRLV